MPWSPHLGVGEAPSGSESLCSGFLNTPLSTLGLSFPACEVGRRVSGPLQPRHSVSLCTVQGGTCVFSVSVQLEAGLWLPQPSVPCPFFCLCSKAVTVGCPENMWPISLTPPCSRPAVCPAALHGVSGSASGCCCVATGQRGLSRPAQGQKEAPAAGSRLFLHLHLQTATAPKEVLAPPGHHQLPDTGPQFLHP